MSRDALIVGINRYQYPKPLKSSALDAEAVAQRLEEDREFRAQRLPEKIEGINEKKPIVSNEPYRLCCPVQTGSNHPLSN